MKITVSAVKPKGKYRKNSLLSNRLESPVILKAFAQKVSELGTKLGPKFRRVTDESYSNNARFVDVSGVEFFVAPRQAYFHVPSDYDAYKHFGDNNWTVKDLLAAYQDYLITKRRSKK